jgi:hypothetical protein
MKITYYTFSGNTPTQSEGLKVAVSESRQAVWICSSGTNFKFVNVFGYGPGKVFDSQEEMDKCMAMNPEEFEATMLRTFCNLGYSFVKKEVDGE